MPIAASNKYQVEAYRQQVPIDFDAPYAPTTMTYHGFSIQIGGTTIGRIRDWTPQALDRDAVHVYELNAATFGQPVDLVPGVAKAFEISFARAEVWGEEVERAFGETDVYTLLTNQNRPFQIDEVYKRGKQIYRIWRYLGCWFTSKSFGQYTADGDTIITCDGTLMFVNKIPIINKRIP